MNVITCLASLSCMLIAIPNDRTCTKPATLFYELAPIIRQCFFFRCVILLLISDYKMYIFGSNSWRRGVYQLVYVTLRLKPWMVRLYSLCVRLCVCVCAILDLTIFRSVISAQPPLYSIKMKIQWLWDYFVSRLLLFYLNYLTLWAQVNKINDSLWAMENSWYLVLVMWIIVVFGLNLRGLTFIDLDTGVFWQMFQQVHIGRYSVSKECAQKWHFCFVQLQFC